MIIPIGAYVGIGLIIGVCAVRWVHSHGGRFDDSRQGRAIAGLFIVIITMFWLPVAVATGIGYLALIGASSK